MVYFYVGGERIIPTMIGMLIGTKDDVRIGQEITSPVSGLVEEASTNFLCLYSLNSV